MDTLETEIQLGLCHCGCGQQTTRTKHDDNARGLKAGDFSRFVHGHWHHARRSTIPTWGKFSQKRQDRIRGNHFVCLFPKIARTPESFDQFIERKRSNSDIRQTIKQQREASALAIRLIKRELRLEVFKQRSLAHLEMKVTRQVTRRNEIENLKLIRSQARDKRLQEKKISSLAMRLEILLNKAINNLASREKKSVQAEARREERDYRHYMAQRAKSLKQEVKSRVMMRLKERRERIKSDAIKERELRHDPSCFRWDHLKTYSLDAGNDFLYRTLSDTVPTPLEQLMEAEEENLSF